MPAETSGRSTPRVESRALPHGRAPAGASARKACANSCRVGSSAAEARDERTPGQVVDQERATSGSSVSMSDSQARRAGCAGEDGPDPTPDTPMQATRPETLSIIDSSIYRLNPG